MPPRCARALPQLFRHDARLGRDWNDDLHLAEVVVGMRNVTCKRELERALDGYGRPVQFIQAQASPTSFAVEPSPDPVRNHDDARYFIVRDKTLHPVEF